MNIAIAIFAKNPDLSPVKTRLAKDIGKEKAIEVYRSLLEHTQKVVKHYQLHSQHNITPYWALAEKESIDLPEWQNFKTLWTGEGKLGDRLHTVYDTLIKNHEVVILIGSDCPDINFSEFDTCIENHLLKHEKCIIGPCEDGGFYLFAYDKILPGLFWKQINYSTATTFKELVTALTKLQIATYQLPTLFDIDTVKDLPRKWI